MQQPDEEPRQPESQPARPLVIIPAFNEAASIGGVIDRVRVARPDADILVVDDGSSDGTATLARHAGAKVASLPFNLGVGGAMRTGYRFAAENGYATAIQVDGDGQHDPAFITALVDALSTADVVIGARFAGEMGYSVSWPRRMAMRGLARIMSGLLHTPITDATSGFRATNRRAIELFARNYPEEYLGDTLEALIIARKAGLVVTQRGVRMSERASGRPSQGPARSLVHLARALAAIGLGLIRSWPREAQG